MEPILFFDTDEQLRQFHDNYLSNIPCVFFDRSLNDTTTNELKPYQNSKIISIFAHSEILSRKKLNLFPDLKLIATRSTGFNHIDLDYCQKRKIIVENVPAYGAITVAEFAFGLLLNLSRKILKSQNDMRHSKIETLTYTGFDLQGKTIGIIGTGSIGQHMIQIAQGFGMNIIAFDPYPQEKFQSLYTDDLKTLFKKSDIISLHIPATKSNRHLLNTQAFNIMKPGVIIINTARGDLIDTQALYTALKSGKIGGAGLDVLENEDFLLHDDILLKPNQNRDFLLDSAMNLKLLQFQNVIATPHIAFNSIDAINRINQTTVQNITAFLNGTIQNTVRIIQ